jgi:hypothetical protein
LNHEPAASTPTTLADHTAAPGHRQPRRCARLGYLREHRCGSRTLSTPRTSSSPPAGPGVTSARRVPDDDRREVPRFLQSRARLTEPRKFRERVCAPVSEAPELRGTRGAAAGSKRLAPTPALPTPAGRGGCCTNDGLCKNVPRATGSGRNGTSQETMWAPPSSSRERFDLRPPGVVGKSAQKCEWAQGLRNSHRAEQHSRDRRTDYWIGLQAEVLAITAGFSRSQRAPSQGETPALWNGSRTLIGAPQGRRHAATWLLAF